MKMEKNRKIIYMRNFLADRFKIVGKKKKKLSTEAKIFKKKCHFGGLNDGILLKHDEPTMESWTLTHFQLKSFTNLREPEFRCNRKKKETEMKIFKKIPFSRSKRWNLAVKR